MLRDFKPLPGVWGKIKPEWVKRLKCSGCGLEEDRDVIAAPQVPDGCGGFFRSPRRPSHEKRRDES
jgi:hypothetical protein